jgi:hypothetical protein
MDMESKSGQRQIQNQNDKQYMERLEWLWSQLTPLQRSQIAYSVGEKILRQQSSSHCFIGEAIYIKKIQGTMERRSICDHIQSLLKTIFWNGPSYDDLLEEKVSAEDKKKLDEIYFAQIGPREHQYQRANNLVRGFVANKIPTNGTQFQSV